jgi:Asp-tRNA(Asn)/Glu-tRNA(Gln) amidotransferase A subunit family amidase
VDEHSVARLLRAGAIPLGKSNVSEFGTIAHTDTAILGPCSTICAELHLMHHTGGCATVVWR